MKAMGLGRIASLAEVAQPLRVATLPDPRPREHELLLRVSRCGVCHTELDEIEGRTPPPRLPVVLGHQVVGVVKGVQSLQILERPTNTQRLVPQGLQRAAFVKTLESLMSLRVGVAWIASACGHC